ncbi:guanine nucleotide-binding protein subunit alpha, variant 2 [Entomophthora muscae]|uniref:Guanine nucleotide-binding protein subunit alpha, variant 2 n=2 Tax=Entomophthora muscae TaxID=34485 RepID=A0ACC2STL0_9FUNG|nr:guanine nucleotide-binding protein subunit alpha, variant 2 [Entomophthora muscae]
MGCMASKPKGPEELASAKIDQMLKVEKLEAKEFKILLLGAGESGKSTIVKQMKLLHGGGFHTEEVKGYKEIIFSNLFNSMDVLLESLSKLGLSLESPQSPDHARFVQNFSRPFSEPQITPALTASLRYLWEDPGVQAAMLKSNEIQIIDSATYYFTHLDRIASPDFVPSDQDILRSRIKTTGITETQFKIDEAKFRMMDVGGQRSERKKWIHCFEGVTAVLYLIAISEYDQTLAEDDTVNRMYEALNLFSSVCNSKWFRHTSVILFLNKTDIFREKIKVSPISKYFPDYKGGSDFDQGANYFRSQFEGLNKIQSKHVYTHFTCATDTNNIQFVMAAVKDILMQTNLRQIGLL